MIWTDFWVKCSFNSFYFLFYVKHWACQDSWRPCLTTHLFWSAHTMHFHSLHFKTRPIQIKRRWIIICAYIVCSSMSIWYSWMLKWSFSVSFSLQSWLCSSRYNWRAATLCKEAVWLCLSPRHRWQDEFYRKNVVSGAGRNGHHRVHAAVLQVSD